MCDYRPLGPENLLLRGARLKNTKEIFGESIMYFFKCKQFRKVTIFLQQEIWLKTNLMSMFFMSLAQNTF